MTPAGGSVRIVTAPGSIRVEDTGPGLRPEELEQAFDRFYLYSRYGRERPVGTGLGLAIVKELAQGMGGSVSVESTPGELTVFTVRLPHDAATARQLTRSCRLRSERFTPVLRSANGRLTAPGKDEPVRCASQLRFQEGNHEERQGHARRARSSSRRSRSPPPRWLRS